MTPVQERAVLAVVVPPADRQKFGTEDLEELVGLAVSAGAEVVHSEIIYLREINPDSLLGKGRVERLREVIDQREATVAIFDASLSPRQYAYLEDHLNVRVVDRIQLILDIFSLRAGSREGKLQVELARLKHLYPRIRGKGLELSRLGGGIGTRGPGETYLETRQRFIGQRISRLTKVLDRQVRNQSIRRAERRRHHFPQAALIGYTNAGKTTIFNRLTDSGASTADRLFETLEPTVRKLTGAKSGREFLISDTVGFIRRLPPDLLASFRSTLDEAYQADLLVVVADASHPELDLHLREVGKVLEQLALEDRPRLLVLNKIDRVPEEGERSRLAAIFPEAVEISAVTREGMERLLTVIEGRLFASWHRWTILIPFGEEIPYRRLERQGRILGIRSVPEGTEVTVESPFVPPGLKNDEQ